MVSKDISAENVGPKVGVRHLQSMLIFFGLCVSFMQRVNLSVAIVAMMDRNSTNPDYPEYSWTEQTKSLLLSSFFWGYFLTQIPGGQLAQHFGGKKMLLFSVGISAFLALFTPYSAQLGDWQFICALRFLQGFCQGSLYPSTHTILARWAPPAERGILATICFSGSQFGTIIILSISGTLAASKYGWPSIFYVSGACGIMWSFVWLLWGADSPHQSKLITPKEQYYIESAIEVISKSENNTTSAKLPTPWLSIFTSLPFWVLLIANCAYNWGFWTLMTQIPSYIKNVFDKDIKSNALLSALPYAASLVLGLCFCTIGQVLLSAKVLSTNASRKIFNTIGMWVPAAATIALGFVDANSADLAVILLTVAVGTNSATFLGGFVNHIDLSPNFAGTLMGITNCAANCMSIIAPLFVGVIVTDTTNPNQWRLIFYVVAFYYFIGNLLFITLGSTKLQPWNEPVKRDTDHERIKFQVVVDDQEHNISKLESSPRVGVRHLQSFLIFLGFSVGLMQRTNLSVAIVAMMDRNSTNPDFPEYDWSEQTKSLVLSSYFWGYFLIQIPGGQLTQRYGGKVMLLFSVGIGGFLTILTPFGAQLGDWQFTCALRFLQGFCQATLFPSGQIILARWAPPAERGMLVTLCFSGMQFGTVIILSISGTLATSKFGWPSIFYVSGGCGIIWSLMWLLWGAESPRQSKLITPKERNYIESALEAVSKSENNTTSAKLATPWLSIFTSVPFWALNITHCAYNWGYWILLTQIPSYIKNVFDKDIQSNALISALPYAANLVLGLCFCALGQVLLSKKVLSTNASRKIFNTIGMWIPMAATIPLGFVDANSSDLAVILLTLAVGINSAVFIGFFVNYIELSPNFAATLMGITNFGATLMSIIGPLVVGVIVTDTTNPNQWRIIFYTMAFSYFIGNLLFITLGSTTVQPWNEPVKRNANRVQQTGE